MEQNSSMNAPLSDEQLEQVAGGTGVIPPQRFQEGDRVKVEFDEYSTTKYNLGRICDCEYDEELGEWTYLIEYGYYNDANGMWVAKGSSHTYYPQSRISRLTNYNGYYAGD